MSDTTAQCVHDLERLRDRLVPDGAWPWLGLNIHIMELTCGSGGNRSVRVRALVQRLAQHVVPIRSRRSYESAYNTLDSWQVGQTQAGVRALVAQCGGKP